MASHASDQAPRRRRLFAQADTPESPQGGIANPMTFLLLAILAVFFWWSMRRRRAQQERFLEQRRQETVTHAEESARNVAHIMRQAPTRASAEAAASEGLAAAGVTGVDVVAGSLKAGAPGKGPFDAIFVNGAVEVVPQAWLDQLAEGGRLAVAVAEGGVRRARLYTRAGGKTAWLTPFDASPPSLPGFEKAAEFRL